jgi:hypothetical protein
MLVYDWCSRGWHMACLTSPLERYRLANGFALGAPSRHGSHNYIIGLIKKNSLRGITFG